MMRKNTANYLVDLVALLAMLGMVFTGLLIRWILPPGSGGGGRGESLTLWGLGRHDWGDVHAILACVLGVAVLVHVVLHWNWVIETTRQFTGRLGPSTDRSGGWRRGAYGAGFLAVIVVLLAAGLWLAGMQVESSGAGRDRPRDGYRFRGDTVSPEADVVPRPGMHRATRPGGGR